MKLVGNSEFSDRSSPIETTGNTQKMSKKTWVVRNNDELFEALRNSNGGEEIKLAYNKEPYELHIVRKFFPNGEVKLTSLNPNKQAVFGEVKLDYVNNLHFENVTFKSHHKGEEVGFHQLFFKDTKNVSITDSDFKGAAKGIRGSGDDNIVKGIRLADIRHSENFEFSGNNVTGYNHGLYFRDAKNATVKNNDISKLQGDGIRMVDINNIVIEGNHLHDFLGSTYNVTHVDMIQLWSTGAKSASKNIFIRSNTLDSGSGVGTQTIHMRNELVDLGIKGRDFYYKNIVIEDNTIKNGHIHGINMGEVDGLLIKDNDFLINRDTPMEKRATADRLEYAKVLKPMISINTKSKNVEIVNQEDDVRWAPKSAAMIETKKDQKVTTPVKPKPKVEPQPEKQPDDEGKATNDKLYADRTGDRLDGGAGNDLLVGYGGDDYLRGGTGRDNLRGGGGDDTLVIDDQDRWVQGGRGTDRAVVEGDGLVNLSRGLFHSIEEFDMRNGEANELALDFGDLRSTGELFVFGDSQDEVVIDTNWGRVQDHFTTEQVVVDGKKFTHYQASKGTWLDVDLYVANNVDVEII